MDKKPELENVGAIWNCKSKSGNNYMNLVIGDQKYLVFPNKNKKTGKQPDFTVHKKDG